MRKRPRTQRLAHSSTARLAQIAIIVLGTYLLLLFATGIIGVGLLVRSQERFLPDYLELVGRAISDPPRDYFWLLQVITDPETGALSDELLAIYGASIDWENLSDSIEGASREAFIQSAHLLTPTGEIILDTQGEIPPEPERHLFQETEQDAIAQAASGETVANPSAQGRYVYMPVEYPDGELAALLRLESSEHQNVRLQLMRNRLIGGFFIAAVILALLYYSTIRLVRRTLDAERTAAQAGRLRALGTMTAGIAHEIRNPLGILTLQIEELKALAAQLAESKQRNQITEIANDLETDTQRLKALTEQFLQFSTDSHPAERHQFRNIDAVEVARSLVKLWGKGLRPERREIVTRLPEEPCHVHFSEDSLRQILLNLLRNADEAIGNDHGRIELGLRRTDRVEIWVEDNGPGIEPAIQAQLFDPFFTTRAGGTGLGLSLSRNLAEAAGGDLKVESTPGKGTRFTLTLPWSAEKTDST